MVDTRGLRAVTYARISVEHDESTSLVRQRDQMRAWCQGEGVDIVAELVDPGMSGGKARQRQADALAMLRDGAADVLVVAALDRWSRQGVGAVADLDVVLTEREKTSTPALFVALRDGLRSDATAWRLVASVLSEVARAERENTSARTVASLDRLAKDRRWRGGTVPYGYRAEPVPPAEGVGWRLVVDDDGPGSPAAVMRDIAARVLSGQGVWRVARALNTEGIPSATGGQWTAAHIRERLTSPRMVGQSIHRGAVVREEDGRPAVFWPPVLDVETWERLRVVLGADLDAVERAKTRRRRAARLLSGVVLCRSCMRPLYVGAGGGRAPTYQCETQRRGLTTCQTWTSIHAERTEEAVAARFLDRYGDGPAYERVVIAAEDSGLAEITRAIAATTADLAREATPEAFARLQGLQARRDDLARVPNVRRVELRPTGQTVAERWEEGDLERRRAMIAARWTIVVSRAEKGGRWAPILPRLRFWARPSATSWDDPMMWSPEGGVVDLGDEDDWTDEEMGS